MRVRVGDILVVDGDSVTIEYSDDKSYITHVLGFTKLQLKQSTLNPPLCLEFDVSAKYDDHPLGFGETRSEIRFESNSARKKPVCDDGDICIEISPRKKARITFHYSNPLTPFSAGYWFRFRIVRENQYLLHAANPLALDGIYSRDGGLVDWQRTDCGPSNDMPVADWVDKHLRKLDLGKSKRSAEQCELLKKSGILDAGGHKLRDAEFSLRITNPSADDYAHRPVATLTIPESDAQSQVNVHALGLNDDRRIIPRTITTQIKLRIECARFRDAKDKWCVDWIGVPSSGPFEGRLSLRTIWQILAQHYWLGRKSLTSRAHLSFLPTDVHWAGVQRPWVLRYVCEWRGAGAPTFLELVTVHTIDHSLHSGRTTKDPKIRFSLGLARDIHGKPLEFITSVASVEKSSARSIASTKPIAEVLADDPRKWWLIDLNLGESYGDSRSVVIGGVLFDLGVKTEELESTGLVAIQGGHLKLTRRQDRTMGQSPIDVDVKLTFKAGRPVPATEDPERGFALDDEWLNRERPIVFDMPPYEATGEYQEVKTLVEVAERANAEASHTIDVRVAAAEDISDLKIDVVILDPSPMRVARVKDSEIAKEIKETDPIATFHDDPDQAMGWEFATETGELDLILPPQAIGEEMIKANLAFQKKNEDGSTIPVPHKNKLFDFRLSPSTVLRLDRTDIETARAPAPWTLRRILDRREGVVGLALLQAEFELLYGMTTKITKGREERLRLADLSALVGRIPFASELLEAYDKAIRENIDCEKPDPSNAVACYVVRVAQWIRSLLYYPSQLPVFRDWAKREQLVIGRNVEFAFRHNRQTSDPFEIENLNPDAERLEEDSKQKKNRIPPLDKNREPLRGGVDFGFESEEIYEAVLKHDKVDVEGGPQGHVAGLVFGALGGTGSQEALFDEGRTLIISHTAQGRLDTLTIVRVGRIAMLWNHARHVIVYERSTRTAPRYVHDQPDYFKGLAALRKVKEYIDITQPHRAYPDVAGIERKTGPLVGSFFESTVIPVRSNWGVDITDGFVIDIHGPVPNGLEHFYPVPTVFLEFARPLTKGGKVSQIIRTPERLRFYTSTRKGEGSNPDNWSARAGVDFPVTQRPRPPAVAYLPAFEESKLQPDAQEYDYGQSRYTVDVAPADEAVNLMHGRSGDGIEARIRNVSLSRGAPQISASANSIEAVLGQPFAALEAEVGDTIREISLYAAKLAQANPIVPIGRIPDFQDTARKLLNRSGLCEFRKKLIAHQDRLEKDIWKRLQDRWVADSLSGWRDFAQEALHDNLQNILNNVAYRLEIITSETKAEATSRLRTALDVAKTQTLERFDRFAFVPQRALERLSATILVTKTEFEAFLGSLSSGADPQWLEGGIERTWYTVLDDLRRRFNTDAPATLEAELHGAIHRETSKLKGWVDNSARRVKDGLGSLFPDLPDLGQKGPTRRLVQALRKIHDSFSEWIRLVDRELIPPFELGEPDWEFLKNLLSTEFLHTQINDEFATVLKQLEEPFKCLIEKWYGDNVKPLRDQINKWYQDKKNAIEVIIRKEPNKLRKEGKALLAELRSDISGEIAKYEKVLESGLDHIKKELTKIEWLEGVIQTKEAIEILDDEIAKAIDTLQQKIDNANQAIGDFAEECTQVVGRAVGGLRNVGERIEEAVLKELGDVVKGAEEGALEVVRALAESPVTDTLRSTRKWVGYYYDAGKEFLELTRSGALFNDLGKSALNGLSSQVPFDRIRDRLLAQLRGFDLNKLLPDFAGLKLEHLFEGVTIPEDPTAEYDWIDLRHGFDKHRLSAWSEVAIDRKFGESLEVFRLEPLGLRVRNPRFKANSRLEAGRNQPLQQRTEGKLSADWVVDLNGEPILTVKDASLVFDERGLDFQFKATNLRLAPAMQFITDALQSFMPEGEGLNIAPIAPGGIRAELSVPVPDIGTGAFTMTGITICSHFSLMVAGGFEVSTGLWLSRPDRPFGIAILFLGGGGWFGVDVRYRPPQVFETRVSIGLSAGAMVAVNFGVARGSAGLLFSISLDFYRNWMTNGSGDIVVTIGLLIWGEFNVLGIASAYIRITLRIEYRNGSMTGYGQLVIKIKICWCFTLKVNKSVRKQFGGGSSQAVSDMQFSLTDDDANIRKALEVDFANLDW